MLAVLHGLPGGAVVKKIYLQMQELHETQVNPEVKKGPGGGNGSVLAWKILWTEEPGGLPFMGSGSQDQTRFIHQAHTHTYNKSEQSLLKKEH